MATKKTDTQWIHRHVGLAAQFMAQDQGEETGETKILESTILLGQVPDKEIWIVRCDFNCTDAVADGEYWWPVEEYLAVYKQENSEPIVRHATDEEITLFEDKDEDEEGEPYDYPDTPPGSIANPDYDREAHS